MKKNIKRRRLRPPLLIYRLCYRKKRFSGLRSARLTVDSIGRRGAFMRAYQCDICRRWHLSSKEF